jgi:hypothetical protein
MRHQPVETLGQSLLYWDQFYSDNYSWLFEALAEQHGYETGDINNEIEKLFTKLVLHKPELIISGTTAQLKAEFSKFSTGHFIFNDEKIEATQLLNHFYCAN